MFTIEEIIPLLYTYDDEEYRKRARTPNYSFEITRGDQRLHYFGTNHSRDISNPQYEALRTYWADFLEKTNGKNAVVFVEGGVRRIHPDEETAVREDSDPGFVTLLAHKANIACYSPEPPSGDIEKYVLENFPEDELNYYYFARMVNQWNHIPDPRPAFEHYMRTFSLEEMKRMHMSITGVEFNESDKELFALLSNPTKRNNPLHKLIRAFGVYRNAFIVQEIEKVWSEGKNIFIVYGGSHPILQERALRTLLT